MEKYRIYVDKTYYSGSLSVGLWGDSAIWAKALRNLGCVCVAIVVN